MKKNFLCLMGGVLLSLPLLFASCGNGDNALEEIINGGGSGGGSTAVTEITIDLTALDAKYYRMAGDYLYGELAISLDIPRDQVEKYIDKNS